MSVPPSILRFTVRFFGALVVFQAIPVLAQHDYAPTPLGTGFWGSVRLASGASGVDDRQLVISDFRRLLAGTDFGTEDISAYQQSGGFGWRANGSSSAVVLDMGIHPFRTAEGGGPELRMGLTYVNGTVGSMELYRSERYALDTLVSSATGSVYLVDSVFESRFVLEHNAERFGVEGFLTLSTGHRSRWSLHGGGGLGIGARINTRTLVSKTAESVLDYPGNAARYELLEERYEQVDNSGGLWVAFQAVIGAGFRLSKRNNLLGRMDLYIEVRPGMLVQGTGEFGTVTSFGSQSLFGLRFRLD